MLRWPGTTTGETTLLARRCCTQEQWDSVKLLFSGHESCLGEPLSLSPKATHGSPLCSYDHALARRADPAWWLAKVPLKEIYKMLIKGVGK